MAKVSIIIPTRCRPHLLARAVRSAQAAGENVEVIVIDDASTDATTAVSKELDGITYVRLEHNLGVAGARNVGLLASRSEFVAFLDDDDLRLPGSIDEQVAALEAAPEAGMCCGSYVMADQSGDLTGTTMTPNHSGGDAFWDLLALQFPIIPISVLVRRSCFLSVGLFRTTLSGIDDWDMFVRIGELFPVAVLDRAVCVYREPTPVSGQGSSQQTSHLMAAARHQRRLLELPRARGASKSQRREIRRRCTASIADVLLEAASRRAQEGEYRGAYANLYAALRVRPSRAARIKPKAYAEFCSQMLGGLGKRGSVTGVDARR